MQNKKIVLDTSFLSAFLILEDAHHKKAMQQFENWHPDNSIYIPANTLIETAHIVKRLQLFRLNGLKTIVRMLNAKIILLDKTFLNKYLDFIFKEKPNLKTIDSTILFAALSYDAELVTFDKKLSEAYSSLLQDE